MLASKHPSSSPSTRRYESRLRIYAEEPIQPLRRSHDNYRPAHLIASCSRPGSTAGALACRIRQPTASCAMYSESDCWQGNAEEYSHSNAIRRSEPDRVNTYRRRRRGVQGHRRQPEASQYERGAEVPAVWPACIASATAMHSVCTRTTNTKEENASSPTCGC